MSSNNESLLNIFPKTEEEMNRPVARGLASFRDYSPPQFRKIVFENMPKNDDIVFKFLPGATTKENPAGNLYDVVISRQMIQYEDDSSESRLTPDQWEEIQIKARNALDEMLEKFYPGYAQRKTREQLAALEVEIGKDENQERRQDD